LKIAEGGQSTFRPHQAVRGPERLIAAGKAIRVIRCTHIGYGHRRNMTPILQPVPMEHRRSKPGTRQTHFKAIGVALLRFEWRRATECPTVSAVGLRCRTDIAMPKPGARKELSLKWLEIFQLCSRNGSLRKTAEEAGLSISTVSHHLRSLEDHLGVELFNHTRRPMVLTPKGHVFLRDIDIALQAVRKAKAEASAGNLAEASYLRLGTIEDLESDIIPDLAVYLSQRMPDCDFLYHTDTSHEIIEMLRDRELDLGIATPPPERLPDLQDQPLLRDPFVIVLPAGVDRSVSEVLTEDFRLPFLRFSPDLIIARQIEAQLRRVGLSLPHKFECGSNQTLMAMVAAGSGWTITTPLLFSRAKRFQPKLRMQPFPRKRFSRTLSLITTPDCSRSLLDIVNARLRGALQAQVIGPLVQTAPWLKDQFRLVDWAGADQV
jgi:DNA-binding transcriptional LysR family regulator